MNKKLDWASLSSTRAIFSYNCKEGNPCALIYSLVWYLSDQYDAKRSCWFVTSHAIFWQKYWAVQLLCISSSWTNKAWIFWYTFLFFGVFFFVVGIYFLPHVSAFSIRTVFFYPVCMVAVWEHTQLCCIYWNDNKGYLIVSIFCIHGLPVMINSRIRVCKRSTSLQPVWWYTCTLYWRQPVLHTFMFDTGYANTVLLIMSLVAKKEKEEACKILEPYGELEMNSAGWLLWVENIASLFFPFTLSQTLRALRGTFS